jgi:VIT1/CCC1 family predicted Fe2+/Mn2+ transporter
MTNRPDPNGPRRDAGVATSERLISARELLLDPIDRVSEIIFGLIMAVTIVGSLSIATAGANETRTVTMAALGCNLAWGLVDAVMHLVRTLTERRRNLALAKRALDVDARTAHRLITATLPDHVVAIVGPDELEGMRRRLQALSLPRHAGLGRNDYLAAAGIFVLVVGATFPVAVPFLVTRDAASAMSWSRIITLAMLFAAGLALGRYAGHAHPLRTGLLMLLLGAALITAVKALGG